eukprot:5930161-Pyramimonas_sp.AAC.1
MRGPHRTVGIRDSHRAWPGGPDTASGPSDRHGPCLYTVQIVHGVTRGREAERQRESLAVRRVRGVEVDLLLLGQAFQ